MNGIKKHKYHIGIALSGGGALGYAHIGVLQALEEYNICPNIISGSSMGSLIGLFYASGYSSKQIYNIIKREKLDAISNIIAPSLKESKLGLSTQKRVLNIIKKYIKYNSFETLRIPFCVAVSNLSTGNIEYWHKGTELHSAVLASTAIPGVFNAVTIDDMIYVDGGLLNNFPVQPIRNQCKYVIGVNVKAETVFDNPKNVKDILFRSLQLVVVNNSQEGEALCDVLICPDNKHLNDFSFRSFEKIYQSGYNSTKKYFEENPNMINSLLNGQLIS